MRVKTPAVVATFIQTLLLATVFGCEPSRDGDEPASEESPPTDEATAGIAAVTLSPGEMRLESADAESGIVGSLGIDGDTVTFSSELDPTTNTARAVFRTGSGSLEVETQIFSRTEGLMRWRGIEYTGYGELTEQQESNLLALGDSEIGRALALIPMELGCQVGQDDLTALMDTGMQRAALVMPWQMLIKYDITYPDVFELHAGSSCRYLPDLDDDGVPLHSERLRDLSPPGLNLAMGDQVPHVFGYFPFDEAGSVDGKELEEKGGCEGAQPACGGADICHECCRGACGPGCDHKGCDETQHFVCEKDSQGNNTGVAIHFQTTYECGSAGGCRAHDGCYDSCHQAKGCGTWSAAFCRRGCDSDCIEVHGLATCAGWARGGGPFDSSVTFCKEEDGRVPNPEDCPPNNDEGTSQGDPHVRTFDGLTYDFQAVGEFVLVESSNDGGGLVVQVRQEPIPGSPCRDVSVNTAIAVRLGDTRVAIYADRDVPLWIDGAPISVDVGDSLNLANVGSVVRTGATSWTLVWPDAVHLSAVDRGDWLDLNMSFPAGWEGETQGLLGTYNQNPRDDLRARDGTLMATPIELADLYARFGESYRIGAEESLFDYDTGRDWASYQDPEFPHGLGRIDDIPTELRDSAEEVCHAAGVSDSDLLAACILDVACTGDDGAADALARTEAPTTVLAVTYPNYGGPPGLTRAFPEAVVSGGAIYLSGTNLASVDGAIEFTRIQLSAGDAQILLPVTGSADQPSVAIPADIHERIHGAATLTVRTPAGESVYANPVFFDEAPFFGDTVHEPGQGLRGVVYGLRGGTGALPDSDDPCGDPTVVSNEETSCPYSSIVVPNLNLPPRPFTEGFPGLGAALQSFFAIHFTGYVQIETAGTYQFEICSDDGSRLRIGDLVIENGGIHPNRCRTGAVDLGAGSHPISIEYFQGPPTRIALQLYWTPPGAENKEIVPPAALRLFE